MTERSATLSTGRRRGPRRSTVLMRLLLADKWASVAAMFLALLFLIAVVGPPLLKEAATGLNLGLRNSPPFTIENGWLYVLGGDSLGRSMLARLVVASRTTLLISSAAVLVSLGIGGFLGTLAGYAGGWVQTLIMRLTDIVLSFPSLLLAVVILYVFNPSVANVVLILAITRIPIYTRVARAETLEVRERPFVDAARVIGSKSNRIVRRHIVPVVLPSLIAIVTLEFAFVMLSESALSFLGIGIQPPDITWGLMVSQGRSYLQDAWWLTFFPGVAIMLTALAANLLSNWIRLATDPVQRWRLESVAREKDETA